MQRWLEFPNPVNDKAARSVAALVLIAALAVLATHAWWLLPVMAAGFALRVAFGPRVSPAALLATRVIAPRLGAPVPTPGPPKRFAQAIGLAVTGGATLAAFAFDSHTTALALTALIAVAAGLEAILGICIGCRAFAVLMRIGLIPRRVCMQCARGEAFVS